MEDEWAVICEGEGGRKWMRLVVDLAWLRPHAGVAGCRSDGDDKVGAHDWETILCLVRWKVPLPFAEEGEPEVDHLGRSVVVVEHTAEHTHCDTGTHYNNLGYGKEVVGWPSLQRR